MSNKQKGFLIAAVLIYLFFYFVIPVTFVHGAQMFWAFVGGIGAAVCIFFAGKESDEKRFDIDHYKTSGKKESLFIVLAVLVGFVGSFVLYFVFGKNETNFIKANPVVVQGSILDGVSKVGRKSSSYELTVRYVDSNAIVYKENIDVSASEWGNAGKGMDVAVVYEKNNPEICKLLMNAKDVMPYLDKNKKVHPSLKNLADFLNTKDYRDQKKILGEYWSVNKMEEMEDGVQFSNYITKDNLVISEFGNIYINENDQEETFNSILAEAKASMKLVYDSMQTNAKVGVEYENDSMKIRFQKYKTLAPTNSGGEYKIMGYQYRNIMCFGFAKKDKLIILLGDLEKNETDPILRQFEKVKQSK
jgi:uncharacterized protein YneF (UPF0154 family)